MTHKALSEYGGHLNKVCVHAVHSSKDSGKDFRIPETASNNSRFSFNIKSTVSRVGLKEGSQKDVRAECWQQNANGKIVVE